MPIKKKTNPLFSLLWMGFSQSRSKRRHEPLTYVKIRTSELEPQRRPIEIGLIVDKKTLSVERINRAIANYLGRNYSVSECEENIVYKGFIVERDMEVTIRVRREKHRFEGGCGRMYSRFNVGDVFIFLYETTDETNVTYAREALDSLKFATTRVVPVLMVRYNLDLFDTWQKECPLLCGRTDFASIFSTLCRDVVYRIASLLVLLYVPIDNTRSRFYAPEYCVQSYDNDFSVKHDHILVLDDYGVRKCLDSAIEHCIKTDLTL